MIKGTYKFFIEDRLIAEQDNALTTAGRTIAIKTLLGIVPTFVGSIGYGIGQKENTLDEATKLISDNVLQFQIGRTPVVGSTIDVSSQNDLLVYTATINDPFQYQIYEVGLFPVPLQNANVGIAGSTIFDFDRVDMFTKIGSASSSYLTEAVEARIGGQLFYFSQTDGANGYLSYAATDNTLYSMENYVSKDTFRLAGYDKGTASGSVNFRFYSDETNYFDYTFPIPSASGYFISEVEKGNVTISGNPSWGGITSVKIWQNTSASLYLDGLRIDVGSYAIDTVSGMLSRAVLPTPVRKPAGIPITIEYALALGFNQGINPGAISPS